VLRHQSFERKALAAGFEPASTSLEERRLIPLGHASNSNNNGIDEIRARVILIDNQVPEPLGHDPNSNASQWCQCQDLNLHRAVINRVL
jgi:hypothetical protein